MLLLLLLVFLLLFWLLLLFGIKGLGFRMGLDGIG
jgi:hypothetical protein